MRRTLTLSSVAEAAAAVLPPLHSASVSAESQGLCENTTCAAPDRLPQTVQKQVTINVKAASASETASEEAARDNGSMKT